MMKYIREIASNKFFLSSGVVLAGTTFANAVNYLFNLVLGRMLDPVTYGEVAAYVTLAMIVVVPSGTMAILVTKYASSHYALGETSKIFPLYRRSARWALVLGAIMLVIFWLLSPIISDYLKTSLWPTIAFAFLLPITLISASTKGILQGLHEFSSISIMNVFEAGGKLLFAVVFVYLGWGVLGAVGGILAGTALSYLYSLVSLHKKLRIFPASVTSSNGATFKTIPAYLYVAFFSTLFLSVFGNIDVVLAKHYLGEHDAGQYAALAVLGRIITYGSIAIITVLLPMAAAAKASNEVKKSKKLLGASLGATLLVSAIILMFFVFLPEVTVRTMFGPEYLEISRYLGLFGAIMLLGSLSKVFINYFLATHELKFVYPFGIVSVLQIVFIVIYHNSTPQIIAVLLATNVLLLISMIATYLFSSNKTVVDEPLDTLNNA
jgi:O-antigen/teichoic acid export membrane protein